MSRAATKAPSRRGVTLSQSEYERLLAKAGETVKGDGPPFPKPDANGNMPALEFILASVAREIIRRRRAAGMSQVELADASGVRQATISDLERGKHMVTERVMERIDRALRERERRPQHHRRPRRPKGDE
jgi:ribosome-binding protein aMBF1 (putative translation factor)